jgi:hypothetical protein
LLKSFVSKKEKNCVSKCTHAEDIYILVHDAVQFGESRRLFGALFVACFMSPLLGLFFGLEDGGDMFRRNIPT